MQFTLSDLKTGDIVRTKCGGFFIYIDENTTLSKEPIIFSLDCTVLVNMDTYDASLNNTEAETLSISAVYRMKGNTFRQLETLRFLVGLYNTERIAKIIKDRCTVLYDGEIKKLTVAEVSDALGYTVEIVEG